MSVKEAKSDSTRVTVNDDFSIAVPKGMLYSTDRSDLPQEYALTIMKTERNEYYNENCGDDVEYSLESPGSAPRCLAIAAPSKIWKDEIPGYNSANPRKVRQALQVAEPIISSLYLSFDLLEGRISVRESRIIKQENDFYVTRIANSGGSIGSVTDFCVVTAEALYQGQIIINDTDQEDEIEAVVNRWLSSVCIERKTETVSRTPKAAPREQEEKVIDRSEEAAHEVLISDSDATRVTVNNDFTVAVPKRMLYSTDPARIFNDSAVVIMKTERSEYFDENRGDDAAYDLQSPGDAPRCLAIATPTMVWKNRIPEYDSADPEHFRQVMDQAESMLSQYRDKVRFGAPYRIIKQEEDIFVGRLDSGETPVDFIVITPEGFYQGQLAINDTGDEDEIDEAVDTWLNTIRRKTVPSPQKKTPAKTGETKKTPAKKPAAAKTGEAKKTTAKKAAAPETEEPRKTTAKKSTAAKTGEAKKPAAKKTATAKRAPAQPKTTQVDGTSTAIGETVWIEGDTIRVSPAFTGWLSNLKIHGRDITELPIKRIVLEDGWESVDHLPFDLEEFHQLEQVDLPDTVRFVNERVFSDIPSLQRIEIPPLVEAIPDDFMWFFNSSSHSDLREIVFRGNLVQSIGIRAFYENDCLTALTLPDGLRAVKDSAFAQCKFLQVVLLPGTLEKIGPSAFSGDRQLRYVQVPPSVTDIAPDAFRFCSNVCLLVTPGSTAERFAREQKLPCLYTQYDSVQSLLQGVGYALGQPRFIEDENGNCVAASSMTDEEEDRTLWAAFGSDHSLNDHTWVTVNKDFSIRIPECFDFSTDPGEILEHRALVFINTLQDDGYKKIMGEDDVDFSLAAPFSAPRAFVLQKCSPWPVEVSSFDGSAGPYGPYIRSCLNDELLGPPDSPCIDVIDRNDLIVRYRRNSEGLMDGQEQVFFIIATLRGAYFGQIWVNNTEDPEVRRKTVERWLRGIHTGPCKMARSAPQNPQPSPAPPISAAPASSPASTPAAAERTAAPSRPSRAAGQVDFRQDRINVLYREREEQLEIIRSCRFAFFGRNARRKKAAKLYLAKIETKLEKLEKSADEPQQNGPLNTPRRRRSERYGQKE